MTTFENWQRTCVVSRETCCIFAGVGSTTLRCTTCWRTWTLPSGSEASVRTGNQYPEGVEITMGKGENALSRAKFFFFGGGLCFWHFASTDLHENFCAWSRVADPVFLGQPDPDPNPGKYRIRILYPQKKTCNSNFLVIKLSKIQFRPTNFFNLYV